MSFRIWTWDDIAIELFSSPLSVHSCGEKRVSKTNEHKATSSKTQASIYQDHGVPQDLKLAKLLRPMHEIHSPIDPSPKEASPSRLFRMPAHSKTVQAWPCLSWDHLLVTSGLNMAKSQDSPSAAAMESTKPSKRQLDVKSRGSLFLCVVSCVSSMSSFPPECGILAPVP